MMHPYFFNQFVLEEQRRDLERISRLVEHRRQQPTRHAQPTVPVTLRLGRAEDGDVLRSLAKRSGERAPIGTCVLAEVERRIVAALPLGGGPVLADPSRATAHIIPLLQLRARQINRGTSRWRPPGFRLCVPRWSRA